MSSFLYKPKKDALVYMERDKLRWDLVILVSVVSCESETLYSSNFYGSSGKIYFGQQISRSWIEKFLTPCAEEEAARQVL